MLPERRESFAQEFTYRDHPSKTYRMRTENHRIAGSCDGLDSIRQAVFKILNTERYQYPIYSRNYGVEFVRVLGKPVTYAVPEIERAIREALLQDDRITSVENFTFTCPEKGVVLAEFTVVSAQGSYTESKEVKI